jgi:hypothetical protein
VVNLIALWLGPLYIRAHLELSPLGLEVGLNFSPTLQSGPYNGPCNIKSIGPLVGPKLEILLQSGPSTWA